MSSTSVRTRHVRAVMALSLALGLTVHTLEATSGEAAAQTAPAPAAGAGPRVAFVGDSIGHSAEPQVRQALGDRYRLTSYDSVDGSTIADHRTAVARLLQSASRPEILVIELGTNDAEQHGPRRFDRDLRAMLDLVSPRVAEVRWFDQKDTPTGYYRGVDLHAAMFNRILAGGRFPLSQRVGRPLRRLGPLRSSGLVPGGPPASDGPRPPGLRPDHPECGRPGRRRTDGILRAPPTPTPSSPNGAPAASATASSTGSTGCRST